MEGGGRRSSLVEDGGEEGEDSTRLGRMERDGGISNFADTLLNLITNYLSI